MILGDYSWSLEFVENVKNSLVVKATHGDVVERDGSYALPRTERSLRAYVRNFDGKNGSLSSENTILWSERGENSET